MYAVYFHFVLLMRSQAAEFGLMARAVEALVSQRSERQGEGCERIPRISVAPFLTGDESAKAAVAAEWDDACRHVGFLCVVDHGVPAGVIKECWDASIEYFDRPLSEKIDSVQMSDEYPYGYQGFGTENLQASLDDDELGPGDLKEMFNICLGSAEPAADMPTPRWPRNSARLRAAWSAYYRALQHLSETLYRVCARARFARELVRRQDLAPSELAARDQLPWARTTPRPAPRTSARISAHRLRCAHATEARRRESRGAAGDGRERRVG